MTQWIPTKDRLPDTSRRVYVTEVLEHYEYDMHMVYIAQYKREEDGWIFDQDNNPDHEAIVIAWQELPEPYREN